jgi:hypothetical protein
MMQQRNTDPPLSRWPARSRISESRQATMAPPVCGENMREGSGSAQERTALRDALLRYFDLSGQPLLTRRTARLHAWLYRWYLVWLLIPFYLVLAARFFLSGQRRAVRASKDRAIDLYGQASGVDRQAAADEVVWRLAGQLAPLVDRPQWLGLEPTAEPPGANRAELAAAADALLAYSLAGRRTDDELLAAVLALWDESEDSMVPTHERLVQRGITGRPAQTDAIMAEAQAWRERYRLAWRRWWDRQAEQGSATSPGRR